MWTMGRRLAAIAFLGALGGASACSLLTSFDGFGSGSGDASTPTPADGGDGAASADASNPSDASDASYASDTSTGADVSADGDAQGPTDAPPVDGGCPVGNPGPAMVRVGTFCIDSTEVTVAEYQQFLTDAGTQPGAQPSTCSWNTSTVPENWPPFGPTNQALNGVNWCQAYLYCAWAGKRLCGSPNGGPADPTAPNSASSSQWFQACSRNGDGQHQYPYGNTFDPTVCNGANDAGGPLPSVPTCQGGYPGIFDMSGNVFEWEDSCQPSATDSSGQLDECALRGGAFWSASTQLQCALQNTTLRNDQGMMNDLGIRCCTR
jgi:formylglycine-generating enzyme required for sulfatase activity